MAGSRPRPWRMPDDVALGRWAWGLWAAYVLGTSLYMGLVLSADPGRSLINEHYERASAAWWGRGTLYEPGTFHGFLYLPSCAILYTPLTWGPFLLRQLLVRALFVGVLVAGLRSFAGVGEQSRPGMRFLVLTLFALPLAFQNTRQGQMNPVLTGILLLGAAEVARRRWGRAACTLGLGLAVKPLALVLGLLAGAALPRALGWRLLVAALAVALFPFLFGPPDYVLSQYAGFLDKMRRSSAPTTYNYDLRGLLETGLGVVLPTAALTALRLALALGVLALVLWARPRLSAPRLGASLYMLTACTLMLGSPKNEDPSYLILAPAIGLAFLHGLERGASRFTLLGLALLPLLIALSFELLGGRRYWFRPGLALLFLVHVVVVLRREAVGPRPGSGPPAALP